MIDTNFDNIVLFSLIRMLLFDERKNLVVTIISQLHLFAFTINEVINNEAINKLRY